MNLRLPLIQRFPNRIRELIGQRFTTIRLHTSNTYLQVMDNTKPDYSFWDRARRGLVKGMELSGMFLKPVGSKISAWVMGQAPDWTLDDQYTQDELQTWWQEHNSDILRGYEEALNLGDCYLVINSDLSVTVVPPHVVRQIMDPNDPTQAIGWKIEEKYYDPNTISDFTTVIDEYTAEGHWHTLVKNGVEQPTTVYRNLVGKIPVIHIANIFGADESNGRPEGHALVPVLQRFGDILEAAIKGNIRQGRPTPVIERMGTAEQVRKFWEKFGRVEVHELPDGTTESVTVIDFDPDQLLTLGGEAQFKYAVPGDFAKDAVAILAILFYLILEHTEIPEFVWGPAIGSSKASAESQLEPFLKWLEKKRGHTQTWMQQIAQIVLAYMALKDTKIKTDQKPFYQWRPITDKNGQITLLSVEWAYGEGLIDEATALTLLPLGIVDPKGILDRAKARRTKIQKQQFAPPPAPAGTAPNFNPQKPTVNPSQQDNAGAVNKNSSTKAANKPKQSALPQKKTA